MKILKQESETSRIVQKIYWVAIGRVICRERKTWYGWKVVDWLYTNQCNSIDEYIKHFDITEKYFKPIGIKKQF